MLGNQTLSETIKKWQRDGLYQVQRRPVWSVG
jgi:hypothetical protein